MFNKGIILAVLFCCALATSAHAAYSVMASISRGSTVAIMPNAATTAAQLVKVNSGSPVTVVFFPQASSEIDSISGLPPGSVLLNNLSSFPVQLPAPPGVEVKVQIASVTRNLSMMATVKAAVGAPVAAIIGVPQQNVVAGAGTVTLNGATSTGPVNSYTWVQTAGAPVPLTGRNTATATFPAPSVAGNYTFKLTVTGPALPSGANTSNATASVGVFSAKTYREHFENGKFKNVINVAPTNYVGGYKGPRYAYAYYSTSYVSPTNSCPNCHGPNTAINTEYAQNYHSGTAPGYSGGRWKNASTRFWRYYGYSSNVTPAQAYSNDGCVRCHTTEGYIRYVTSGFNELRAWGFQEAGYTNQATAGAADNTNTSSTAISCRACHTDAAGTIRPVAAVRSYYNLSTVKYGRMNSGAVQYRDFKNSNVCVPCHSGRNALNNGPIINTLAAFAEYTSAGFVNVNIPHGNNGLQAGVLDAKIGYRFGSFSNSRMHHATIGVNSVVTTNPNSGPCVTCHMDNESGHRKHTIDISYVPTVCQNCHGTQSMAKIANAKAGYGATIKALAEIMIDEKLNFTGSPILSARPAVGGPTYLGNTAYYSGGWAYGNYSGKGTTGSSKVRPGANSAGFKYPFTGKQDEFAKIAGALFNLKLLNLGDYGGFAHNPSYARWLLNQSIDAVRAKSANVGGVTVAPTSVADAISKITPNARITADDITAAAGYTSTPTCLLCHSGTSPTAPKGIVQAPHFSAGNADPALKALFGQYTASGIRPSYVSANNTCTTCHNASHPPILQNNRDWALTLHGDSLATTAANGTAWGAPRVDNMGNIMAPGADFKRLGSAPGVVFGSTLDQNDSCVRCHTKTGFVNFITSNYTDTHAWGDPADKTKELLTCGACHSDTIGTLRPVGQFTGYFGYSVAGQRNPYQGARATYTYADRGKSNVCVSCHTSSDMVGVSAALIKKLNTFASYTSVVAPGANVGALIGLPSHGVKAYLDEMGYEFAGRNYTPAANGHASIGQAGGRGPCAGCHIPAITRHTYAATAHKTDYTSCVSCHDGGNLGLMNDAAINAAKILKDDAVRVLTELIRIKFGVAPGGDLNQIKKWYPTQLEMANREKYQGAYYNATFAAYNGNLNAGSTNTGNLVHSPLYTKRLIYDSIDWVYNGALDGDVITAIQSVDKARLPTVDGRSGPEQKLNAMEYLQNGTRP